MDCTVTHLPYKDTNHFSKIVTDYLDQSSPLRAFYEHDVSIQGIQSAISAREKFPTNRTVLVAELEKQYASTITPERVKKQYPTSSEGEYFFRLHSPSAKYIHRTSLFHLQDPSCHQVGRSFDRKHSRKTIRARFLYG
jgi:hypothetical protein